MKITALAAVDAFQTRRLVQHQMPGLRRRDQLAAQSACARGSCRAIEFRDINLEPDVLSRFGSGIEDVRRRLHAVDSEGRLFVDADCAVEIRLRTPGDAWLGRLLGLPVVHQIARFTYDRFADLLYAWNRRKGHW